MRLLLVMIILLNGAAAVLGNNIKDLYLKAGARGLALAIEMESSEKAVFSSRGINGGFEVAIKNCASNLSLTEFTDFGIASPLKSISFIKKNGNILVKGLLKDGITSIPVSKWSGSKVLVLANKNNYPEMTWRASEYDYNDSEDASFAVSDKNDEEVLAPDKGASVKKVLVKDKAVEEKVSAVVPASAPVPVPVSEPIIEKKIDEPQIEETTVNGYVETVKGGINFRSTPNTFSRDNIVAVLELGVRAELLSKSGAWFKVKTERSGKEGWVHSSLVKPVDVADAGEDEVEIADAKAIPVEKNLDTKIVKPVEQVSAKPNIKKYRAFGRDPFLPLDKCDFLLPDLPNVEEANLVGIIYDNMDRIALIETNGKSGVESHTLRENSTIFNGRVLKINEEEVVFLISEAMYSRKYVLKMKDKIED